MDITISKDNVNIFERRIRKAKKRKESFVFDK